jgi:AraC-like DNA-binding protein
MATSPRRVPVRYLQVLRDTLRDNGTDTSRLLHLAGIDEALFNSRDAGLTPLEVDAFISAAHRLTGRDDLGFELGKRIKMNSHDLLGYGLISCSNLDEYMRMTSRHYHLMTETWTMAYRRWYSGGECVYTPSVAMPPESMQFYLETIALAHQNQVQLLLGDKTPAYDIYLSMAQPAHIQRYRALAPARFHFVESAMPGVRVVMGAGLLDIPLALGDPEVVRQIDERCSALGQRPPRGEVGWVDYMMMVLRQANGEQVTLEDIAQRVKVSARTIDRHLKKEGLGFRELSDKIRFERACEMLCAEGASITDVALKLGFSDSANFSRAFKRVVGVSPGEYQRNAALTVRTQ